MLSRIKKDDLVFVLSGKDKGKEGRVIDIDTKKESVLVKNIAIVTRHVKAKKAGDKSGIIKEESYIPLCKVMPVCSSCKKACRMQVKIKEDENKVRVCHRCKEEF
jgi:large subunit ribosomal protein L24